MTTDDEINAWIYKRNHDHPVLEVLDESHQVFQDLFDVVEGLPDNVRIDEDWHLVWFGESYFPTAEFFDHFRDDHEPDVRLWLERVKNQ